MPDHTTILPIVALIESRCRELGIRRADIVRRAGYTNVSKGLRRFEALQEGTTKGNQFLIQGLPAALQVPPEVVLAAVQDTQTQLREEAEQAWRAAFEPHAVLLTEKCRPEPLFLAAILGVDNLLRVDFNLKKETVTFLHQALEGLRKKRKRWGPALPAFGRVTGFVVNYSPDHAVEYDLDGNRAQTLDRAHEIYKVSLMIGRRMLTDGEIAAIFGRNNG